MKMSPAMKAARRFIRSVDRDVQKTRTQEVYYLRDHQSVVVSPSANVLSYSAWTTRRHILMA